MCGRYLSLSSTERLVDHFQITAVRTEPLPVRYNVAPSTEVYSILEDDDGRRLGRMRWGYIPHWVTELRGARQPINARVETVATSRMFARSFASRRCVLPADGFYEWQDRGEGRRKQPFHLADPDGLPLAFAGIWSTWRDPAGDPDHAPVASAAILTTAAKGEIERIHERMPVLLPRTLWREWLTAEPEEAPHLVETVVALGPPALRATPIGARVNSVRNDGAELLEPETLDD